MRLSLIIVNWEIFCWPADVRFAHVHLSHHHARLPSWFVLSCFAALLPAVCPSRPPLGFLKFLCSGKFSLGFYSPLSVTASWGRWPAGGCHGYPPLFALCPHSFAYCLHCSLLAPTVHLNIAYRQVNAHWLIWSIFVGKAFVLVRVGEERIFRGGEKSSMKEIWHVNNIWVLT